MPHTVQLGDPDDPNYHGPRAIVVADAQQIKDAREDGMARVFRLMRYDPLTDTLQISVMAALAAGIPVDIIKARKEP